MEFRLEGREGKKIPGFSLNSSGGFDSLEISWDFPAMDAPRCLLVSSSRLFPNPKKSMRRIPQAAFALDPFPNKAGMEFQSPVFHLLCSSRLPEIPWDQLFRLTPPKKRRGFFGISSINYELNSTFPSVIHGKTIPG